MPPNATVRAATDATYVNFTTFRKNGERKTTPTWIVGDGEHAYLWTSPNSWKAKRLRNDSSCEMTPCNATGSQNLGETARGEAVRITDPEKTKYVKSLLWKKYNVQYLLFQFLGYVRPKTGGHAYYEITER